MNFRRLSLPAVLLALTVAIPVALPKERGVKSDAPAKAPVATAAPAKLRLWKTDLPDTSAVRLTWALAGNDSGKTGRGTASHATSEVSQSGPGYQFGDYAEVSPGRGTVAADANGRALGSVFADLAPGSFYTLLVTATGAELIADNPAAEAGTGDFTLRSLDPAVRTLTVHVGDGLSARFDFPNGLLRMRGLKAGVYSVRTEGTDAAGKPFDWTAEADFTRFPRQTLLVYPDAYGRVRPRLCVDGGQDAGKADKSDQK